MSLPAEFVTRIEKNFPDYQDFLTAITQEPTYSVRLNPRKHGETHINFGDKVTWCDMAFYLDYRPNYTLNPMFHAGLFYPQEASSMFLWRVLDTVKEHLPEEPIVLDLCAAPGGKSTLTASWLDGRGLLVANEVIRSRAWILRENLLKWGYPNVIVTNCDPAALQKSNGLFDIVIVDAPCSGEGMFRKDTAAISQWSVENTKLCASRQRRILADIMSSVKEGGFLIYSTCTFNPAENEENMEWLMSQFQLENICIKTFADEGISIGNFNIGECYKFHFNKTRGEGFFICVMRKLEPTAKSNKAKNAKKQSVKLPDNLLLDTQKFLGIECNGNISAIPKLHEATCHHIIDTYNPLLCGIPIGSQTKKDFAPAAELPLSIEFNADSYPSMELDENQTIKFLKGDTLTDINAPKSWNVVRFEGVALGFIKSIGNRINNYYPKDWRIRMRI